MIENVLSWSAMGNIRDSLNSFLDQSLKKLSENVQVSFFEVTFTLQASDDEQSAYQCSVGSGEVGADIPLGTTFENADKEDEDFRQKLDKIVEDVYIQLQSYLDDLDLAAQGYQVSAYVNTRLGLVPVAAAAAADGVFEPELLGGGGGTTSYYYSCQDCGGCSLICYILYPDGTSTSVCTLIPCPGCL